VTRLVFTHRGSAAGVRLAVAVLAFMYGAPNFSAYRAFAAASEVQQPAPAKPPPTTPAAPVPPAPVPPAKAPAKADVRPVPTGVALPPGYVIGADDILTIVFWRDKDMSADVVVRPDGKVTLPLVNDVDAAGKTPEELRKAITEAASRFVEEPTVSVVVKQINSRRVYITGMVGKSGAYPLSAPTTVLQLISMAGGLSEFAHSKNIIINRAENGRQVALKFNYSDVQKGKNLHQNIELKPGDTVIVP
jgi:polysaccharide export outer membrane protein